MSTSKQVTEFKWGYRALGLFIRLGGYRLCVLITTFVVFFYFLANPSTIKTSMNFYQQLFAGASRLKCFRLTWNQFWNFAILMLDRLLISMGLQEKFILTHEGLEDLQRHRDDGRPAILLIAHAGNWEIASHFLMEFDFKLNLVIGENEGEGIASEQKEGMRKAGINLIIVEGESNLDSVQLIKRLKDGEFAAISSDRVFHKNQKTLQVDFLGRKATVPAGPYVLGLLSGADIYPIFGFREGAFKYRFKAFQAHRLDHVSRPNREQALADTAQLCFDDLATFVRRHPGQWFNFFDFWNQGR